MAQQSAPCTAVRAGRMGPTKCFRVSHLSAALAAVLLLAHVQRAWGSCQKPITPQEGLTCDTADVDSLKSASPDIWWTFTTPPEKYAHARTHTHTRTLAHSHTRTLAHSHTRTLAHAHAHAYAHTHTRTRTHAHTHAHAHAHSHSVTHIQIRAGHRLHQELLPVLQTLHVVL